MRIPAIGADSNRMSNPVTLLARTTRLRTNVLDLLELAAHERPRTADGARLVSRLQHVANDLGSAERMLLADVAA
jgi:hypothetical protein